MCGYLVKTLTLNSRLAVIEHDKSFHNVLSIVVDCRSIFARVYPIQEQLERLLYSAEPLEGETKVYPHRLLEMK